MLGDAQVGLGFSKKGMCITFHEGRSGVGQEVSGDLTPGIIGISKVHKNVLCV